MFDDVPSCFTERPAVSILLKSQTTEPSLQLFVTFMTTFVIEVKNFNAVN